jgi:hypothetical protein
MYTRGFFVFASASNLELGISYFIRGFDFRSSNFRGM